MIHDLFGPTSRRTIVVLLAVSCFWMCGCSSEPTILPTQQHVATTPDKVKILGKRPKKYEQLGTVTVEITRELAWDDRGDANKAFDALKQKAAALGANALVLWAEPGAHDIMATAGYHGEFYQVPIRRQLPTRTAVAQAVYVPAD